MGQVAGGQAVKRMRDFWRPTLLFLLALCAACGRASSGPRAIVLTNECLRAEIVPGWAGRLMFLGRPGGPNALWTQPEAAGFTADQNGGEIWKNFGGEKTWVGSQGAGWRAFAGKESGLVWPPPAWFDSMPMEVVASTPSGVVLRTGLHKGGDWAVRLERSFALLGDRLRIRQRLICESDGASGPDALPDDFRRLWSVAQVPLPPRVLIHLVEEGRHSSKGIPAPAPTGHPGWVSVELAGMGGEGKIAVDGDRLAVPLQDGPGWLVLSQTAPARNLSAFATPGRAMVFASLPDLRPSPYAELEFASYGPDAEQTVEFAIAESPFGE